MTPCLVPFAAVCLIATQPADPARDELKKLEGTWVVESARESGKSAIPRGAGSVIGSIAGNKVTVRPKDADVEEPVEMFFKADPAQKPKAIDFYFDPKDKEPVVKAIYELDGDTLKVCYTLGDTRPTAFDDKDGRAVWVLKRQKKK